MCNLIGVYMLYDHGTKTYQIYSIMLKKESGEVVVKWENICSAKC